MSRATLQSNRRIWTVIVFAMVGAVAIYPIVLVFARQGVAAPPPGSRPAPAIWMPFAVAAMLALMFSMNWMRHRMPYPDSDSATPLPGVAEFMKGSIVGMAAAEAASVIGFLWCLYSGAAWRDYVPFGAGSLLVLLLVCLPRGQAYWTAREAADAARPPLA